MKITYIQICKNKLNPEDDLINQELSMEIVDNSVYTLISKLQKFIDNFPEAEIDNEYPELTIKAEVNDDITYYMMVTTCEEV